MQILEVLFDRGEASKCDSKLRRYQVRVVDQDLPQIELLDLMGQLADLGAGKAEDFKRLEMMDGSW